MRRRRVWPWMVAATILVMVLPPAVVWALSAAGVITSIWGGIAVAAVLALAATSAGSALWRRRATGDVLFADLLPWGWLRRRRMEGRLGRADELLEQAGAAEDRGELLRELGSALDSQDPYLDGHSRRVMRYVAMIARRMDLAEAEVERVCAAAAVHDIGKLRIPHEIVYKPGRLSDDEFEVMKRHAAAGGAMAELLGDPALAAAVRSHHERWDGSGYPDGLAGEAIPLAARIISVADTFDAITSERSYRAATPHARALEVIGGEAGRQLDPTAARAFISCYSDRRGAALWASLATIPRQLAGRLSMTPAELTAAATAALTTPAIVVAGAAAAAAWPAPADPPVTPAAALSAPTPTPTRAQTATPTATDAPTAAPAPTPVVAPPPASAGPTLAEATETAGPTPTPQPTTRAEAATPSPVPTLMPSPLPPPFETPTPAPPLPTPTPSPGATPTPTPRPPHTVEDCKDDGWIDLGYPNQGQCIEEAVDHPD